MRLGKRDFIALYALMSGITERPALDRATKTTNFPMYVFRLRALGIKVSMQPVGHVDSFGDAGWHGHYSLTDADERRAWEVLRGGV